MNQRPLLLAGLAFTLLAVRADAHAFLEHAEPAVGSTVHGSPAELRIRFTEKIEPVFSTIQVFNEAGQEVDKRDKHGEKTNPAMLVVSLPTLPTAHYKVKWRVVSADTHVTQGDFSFQVVP